MITNIPEAIDVANANRTNLATLGQAGIRNAIEERMGILMMSMEDALDSLTGRLAPTGSNLTVEQTRTLANDLAGLHNPDDAAIRTALENAIGNPAAVSDDLIRVAREFVQSSALTIDCSTWARHFADQHGGSVLHLKPKGSYGTGYLPGEVPPRGDYQYHSVVLRGTMIYDELHPSGVSFADWQQEYFRLNNLDAASFSAMFDFDDIPHPNATTP